MAYNQPFQSSYRNVLLVTNNETAQVDTLYAQFYQYGAWTDNPCKGNAEASEWTCSQYLEWMDERNCARACSDAPLQQKLAEGLSNWTPLKNKVDYCLAETSTGMCSLQFHPGITVGVLVLNAFKTSIMIVIVLLSISWKEGPFLTVGDAIGSFLGRKDSTTETLSLISREDMETLKKISSRTSKTFRTERFLWSKAVSRRRWILSLGL